MGGFQSPMDLMNTEPGRLLKPYVGRRAFGNMAVGLHSATEKEKAVGIETPGYTILHSGVTGNDYTGMLSYELEGGRYLIIDPFDNTRLTTSNPGDVLAFLKALPQLIKKQREIDLVKDVRLHRANEIPLERVIERMRMYAEFHPGYGPTDSELQFHREMCKTIYSQNPFAKYYKEISRPKR